MQFLLSVIDDVTRVETESGTATQTGTATQAEMDAIDVFNDRLIAEGHWVFAAGLGTPDTATVVDNRSGKALFTDGPFVESKEFLAGIWIINAPDLETARALATDGSKACHRKVEVRPLLGE